MKAAYAPLTFSWRGAQSGGWAIGVVLARPRKQLQVEWQVSPQIREAAQGGFDLKSTLEAFEERIISMDNSSGSALERLKALESAWGFGTVQVGEAEQIEGAEDEILQIALQEAGL